MVNLIGLSDVVTDPQIVLSLLVTILEEVSKVYIKYLYRAMYIYRSILVCFLVVPKEDYILHEDT